MSKGAATYGWYGDDFTGATDTLAAIARRGQRAFLFLSVPTAEHLTAAGPLDAIGIAGAARTMPPEVMRESLPAVGRFFRERGVQLLHYKCCSTFDSAPHVGNLAAAIEALRPFVEHAVVPVVGGQPSLGRYCAFSNLFASAGDTVHRIDRHPTMSRHPVTPMTEADLVKHFAALGLVGVAAIHWPTIAEGALAAAWRQRGTTAPPAILIDVLDDNHLAAIGALLRRESTGTSMLAVGASSVAEAWFEPGAAENPQPTGDVGQGPVFAFVGSLSPVTRSQVAAAKSYRFIAAQPERVMADPKYRASIATDAAARLAQGEHVMVSTTPLDGTPPVTTAPGLAEASGAIVEEVVRISGVRRVAIAGGDTSTLATMALGFWGLAYHGLAARGSTICRGRSDDPKRDGMLLLLKGGQMGDERVFETFATTAKSTTLVS